MKSQIEVKQLTEELLSFRVLASSQTTHSDNVEAENAKLNKELHDSNHSNEMLSKEIARLWDELNTSEQSRHATDASLLAAHKRIGELELELQSRSDDLLKKQLELSRVSSECSELSSRLQMRAVELKASEDGNVRITRELSDSLDKISTLSSDVVALQGDVHKAELVRVSLSGELSLAAEKITGLTMDARSLQEVLSRSEDELEALTKQSKDTEGRLREESQRCRDAEEAISSLKSANVEKQHEVEMLSKDVSYLKDEISKAAKSRCALESEVFLLQETIRELSIVSEVARDVSDLLRSPLIFAISFARSLDKRARSIFAFINDFSVSSSRS